MSLFRVQNPFKVANSFNQLAHKNNLAASASTGYKMIEKIAEFEISLGTLDRNTSRRTLDRNTSRRNTDGISDAFGAGERGGTRISCNENQHKISGKTSNEKPWNLLLEKQSLVLKLDRFSEIVQEFKMFSHEIDLEYDEDENLSNPSIVSQQLQRDELARKMLLLQFKLVYFIYISDPQLHADLISTSSSLSNGLDSEIPSSCPISMSNLIDLISMTLQYRSYRHDMVNLIVSTLQKTVLFYDTIALLQLSQHWFPSPEMKKKFISHLFLAYLREKVSVGMHLLLHYVENHQLRVIDLIDCFFKMNHSFDPTNPSMNEIQVIFLKLLTSSSTNLNELNREQLYQITNYLINNFDNQLPSSLYKLMEVVTNNLLDSFHELGPSLHEEGLLYQHSLLIALVTKFQLVNPADKLWRYILTLKEPTPHQWATLYKEPLRALIEQFCLSPTSKRYSLGVYRYKRIMALLLASPVGKGVTTWNNPVILSQLGDWKAWWNSVCTRNQCYALLAATY